MRIDGKNCSVYPLCSCMGLNRTMYFDNTPSTSLCNDCTTIIECGSLGCEREKSVMTDRCVDCKTPDTCNVGGCAGKILEPCQDCSELFNCHRLGCLMEESRADVCCGDPSDCNEDCSYHNEDPVDVGEIDLDGRNESPVNQYGCSYVDCDCTVPCTSKEDSKVVNITINGDNYGDIKL
jgi:hypothetical protein